jgi:hypothetical protein
VGPVSGGVGASFVGTGVGVGRAGVGAIATGAAADGATAIGVAQAATTRRTRAAAMGANRGDMGPRER